MDDFIQLAAMSIVLLITGTKNVYLPTLFYACGILTVFTNPIELAYGGFVAVFFGELINKFIMIGRNKT